MRESHWRLFAGFAALLLVVIGGSLGYYLLGGGAWSLGECVYMVFITVTTVGYSETLPGFYTVPGAQAFTVVLIVLGVAAFLYFASTLAAGIIEGDLRGLLKLRRMQKKIERMKDHVIVCGVGSTGRHIVEEMLTTETPVVAVDTDQARLEEVVAGCPPGRVGYVTGDATSDAVLEQAGLRRASSLIAALANDKDNLYLVLTARQANPGARIVARGSDLEVLQKLERAGADAVVSPNYIGGLRMASAVVRPRVVEFLDEMIRRSPERVRIEELEIPEDSSLAGETLADSGLREQTDLLVLAVRRPGAGGYVYGPGATLELEPGMLLVTLGTVEAVGRARDLLAPEG